jgi:hypothetical protein
VGLPAVKLDDQLRVRPDGVDLVAGDVLVRARARQAVPVQEAQEGGFEVVTGAVLAQASPVDDHPQCRCPAAPPVACEEVIEGERAREPQVLRLVNRPLELVGPELFGQVQEGAGGVRHGDAAVHGDLVGRQGAAMDGQLGPRAAVGRHRHVDARR